VLVQCKGDLGFERQAGAFEDDLWAQLVSHRSQYTRLSLPHENAILSRALRKAARRINGIQKSLEDFQHGVWLTDGGR
jgi:hypothetical protein